MPKLVNRPAKQEALKTRSVEEIADYRALVWEVEEDISTCAYSLGKLKLRGAVVGEITLLKNDFKRVSRILCELGVRVLIDTKFMEKLEKENGRVMKPIPSKGQLGYQKDGDKYRGY